MKVENTYVKLNVEKYGGMILSPWLCARFPLPVVCLWPEKMESRKQSSSI